MIEYPKIETLFDRDEKTRKVLPDKPRLEEFRLPRKWIVTEKVDGTNVRIGLNPDGSVSYSGRTDGAQLHATLVEYLRKKFSDASMQAAFLKADDGKWPEATIFGEGYGPKIQSGGSYRRDVAVRLFDVRVGRWWLESDNVQDVAQKLGVELVPRVGSLTEFPATKDDLLKILDASWVAKADGGSGCRAEGIVAKTEPLLLTRRGDRVMWKLKFKDF